MGLQQLLNGSSGPVQTTKPERHFHLKEKHLSRPYLVDFNCEMGCLLSSCLRLTEPNLPEAELVLVESKFCHQEIFLARRLTYSDLLFGGLNLVTENGIIE